MDFKFWLIDIVGILFSAIVSIVLSNLGLELHTAICISVILLLIMVLFQLGVKNKNLKERVEKLNKRLSEESSNVISGSEDENKPVMQSIST